MTKNEALELCDYLECNDASLEAQCKAAAFIREALAQPEQEPVEDVVAYHSDGTRTVRIAPKRPWAGLTDEDTFEIGERLGLSDIAWVDLMQAIEAKLKEKNT